MFGVEPTATRSGANGSVGHEASLSSVLFSDVDLEHLRRNLQNGGSVVYISFRVVICKIDTPNNFRHYRSSLHWDKALDFHPPDFHGSSLCHL